ncbi:MAG: CdaR family protein [Myxococcota bacterium]
MSSPSRDRFERARYVLLSLLLDNLPLKVVSLVIAVGVWIWVQSSLVVTRVVRVRVDYAWPSELVRVEDPPKRLALTLEGPQGRIANLAPRQLSMEVDLTEGIEGENTIDFANQVINGIPQGLSVQQISPMESMVVLEEPLKKVVRVSPMPIGQPARDHEIRNITAEPETVTLIGPRSQLEGISQIPTGIINVNNIRTDTVIEIPLTPGKTIRSLWEGPIKVTVDVEPLMSEKSFNAVKVMITEEGWLASPDTISVRLRGPVEALRRVDGSELAVLARVPEGLSEEAVNLQLRYAASTAQAGLEIINKGPDSIEVSEVSPSRIVLNRKEEVP